MWQRPSSWLRERGTLRRSAVAPLLDLNASYTIETWVRWDPANPPRQILCGDEAWPGMNPELNIAKTSGWVLRTTPIEGADKRGIEFVVAAMVPGKIDWFVVPTPVRKMSDGVIWQHVAVCKTPSAISIYWNGKLAVHRPCRGIKFNPSPTDIYRLFAPMAACCASPTPRSPASH